MQSVTIDILNVDALKLLKDLELLKLIRVRNDKISQEQSIDWAMKYKGSMTKQPISEIDKQLKELRNEWE